MVCMTLGDAVCAVGGQVTREDSLSDRFKAKSPEDCVGAHGTPPQLSLWALLAACMLPSPEKEQPLGS